MEDREIRRAGEDAPTGTALWGWWALATALGWALAGALIGGLIEETSSVQQYAFLPVTALGQWLLLRRHFAAAWWWLVATTCGALAAGIVYALILQLPAAQFGPATSGLRVGLSTLFDGLAIGTAQWLVLRGNVRGTHWWIPATAGPLWLFAVLELGRGTEPATTIESLESADAIGAASLSLGFVGLLIGAVTGALLAWLVEQPRLKSSGWHES